MAARVGVMPVGVITPRTHPSSDHALVSAELLRDSRERGFGVKLRAVRDRLRYAGRPTTSYAVEDKLGCDWFLTQAI